MIINNQRVTKQKIEILNFLEGVNSHPVAEEVYSNVKIKLPKITLATIYRNLNQLNKNNKILKLEINGEYHFDADMSTHQHFVCKECNGIQDIYQKEITELALNKLKEFTPDKVQIIYDGICNKCQGEKK